jgi:hypothetical protein
MAAIDLGCAGMQVSTEVLELTERLSSENAAAELVADRIKATCWDAMEVKGFSP